MLATAAKGFFTIPHFDGYAAVLVALRTVAKKPLREAIEDAWLACAPEKLSSAFLDAAVAPQTRGTPQESLKRSSTQRSSAGTHSHSVMDACTMRTQPRR